MDGAPGRMPGRSCVGGLAEIRPKNRWSYLVASSGTLEYGITSLGFRGPLAEGDREPPARGDPVSVRRGLPTSGRP